MFKNATPETALAFLRLNMTASLFLPLSTKASKLEVTCYNILRILSMLNSAFFFYPILNAVLTYTDPMDISQAVIYLMGTVAAFSYMAVCVSHNNDIQVLVELTEALCKSANDRGGRVYQQYMERYSSFYGISIIWCQATGVLFILRPFVTSDPFPLNALYPFRVDYQPWKSIIYFHQVLFVITVCANAALCMFCAFLLFFAAARFEILKLRLRDVKSIDEMITRMKEYYIVKGYAERVVNLVKFISLSVVITCAVILVFSGINLIVPQPLAAKFQFLFVVTSVMAQVFSLSLPAHHLLDQSEDVMKAVFESTWYGQSKEMQRDVKIMMIPQPPVIVRLPCIIPTLSLAYFCSFLSNAFSIFSVLRITMSGDE